jgi:hypothetical protein
VGGGRDRRSAPASSPEPAAAPALSPAEATGAFLEAMRAAGNPGTTTLPMPDGPKEGLLRRTPEVEGWVVRPVVWDDRDNPRHHQPGLLLTTGGAYHRIDSQIRGWGQRNFPVFFDTAAADALDPPTTSGSPPTSAPCGASTAPRRARSPRGGSATPGR